MANNIDPTPSPDDAGPRRGWNLHIKRGPETFEPETLEVFLWEEPQPLYFDTKRAEFPVFDEEFGLYDLTVTASYTGANQYVAVMGRVRLEPHDGQPVELFTFGGYLTIDVAADPVRCELVSVSPIILMNDESSMRNKLVSAFEVLLAQRRAGKITDLKEHAERVAKSDARQLYVLGLLTVQRQLGNGFEDLTEEQHQEATEMIEREIARMKRTGVWPVVPPTVEDLL